MRKMYKNLPSVVMAVKVIRTNPKLSSEDLYIQVFSVYLSGYINGYRKKKREYFSKWRKQPATPIAPRRK